MKFLTASFLLLSLSAFGQTAGYVCVPENNVEGQALQKVQAKLGNDFLAAVEVVVVRPETCAAVTIPELKDVCKVGSLSIQIEHDLVGTILVSKTRKIRVTCEIDQEVGPFPATGGSN